MTRNISLVLVLLGLQVLGLMLHAAELERPDLTGQIKNEKGEPVANAMVCLLAAGPRTGSSPLCPYCYANCGKKAVSDISGNFRINSLDPTLSFSVNVLAPGYWLCMKTGITPEAGPLQVKLDSRDYSKLSTNGQVRGRVIGPDGQPVVGALLDVDGLENGDGTRYGGIKADAMAVTDSNGEFHIGVGEAFTAVHAVVSAPGLAKRWAKLEPGKMGFFRMNAGVTVKGRVLFNGQPVKNAGLGMVSADRSCGVFLDGFASVTGDDGRFEFQAIPKGAKFRVYSTMESAKAIGAAFVKAFDSGNSDGAVDLGEIPAKPAYHFAGRVVLADGKSIPAGIRLMISRGEAWDTALVSIGPDGRFETDGIPEERVEVYVRIDGYRFSEKNPSLDPENHSSLAGRVQGNLTDLAILLEPGNPLNRTEIDCPAYEELQKLRERPLHGVQ